MLETKSYPNEAQALERPINIQGAYEKASALFKKEAIQPDSFIGKDGEQFSKK